MSDIPITRVRGMTTKFRRQATLADEEIAKTKGPNPTLFIAPDEVARYEQSATTYRACAEELENIIKENGG